MATAKKAPEKPAAVKAAAPAAKKVAKAAEPKTAKTAKTAAAKAAKANTATAPAKAAGKRRKAGNTVPADQRAHYIEVAAFYIAERRGFAPGDPMDDWLAAEAEIDRLLAEGRLG